MRNFTLGLLTMLSVVTLGALVVFDGLGPHSRLPLQVGLLKVLHDAYTFLLTPLSSALGAPSIGGGEEVGLLPLTIWVLSSLLMGLLIEDAGLSAKIVFTSAMMIFMFWIFSSYLVLPMNGAASTWIPTLDRLMSDLLLQRPLDIVFLLSMPPLVSAVTSAVVNTSRRRDGRGRERRTYWTLYQ